MDFGWSDEHRELRDSVLRFARKELAGEIWKRDHAGEFPAAAWKACASFGIQGLQVPEEYGGSGAGALATIAAMEALGYACRDNGLLFSLNAQMWAVQHPICQYGTDEQKRRYLPGLCDGTLVASHAMSEPDSGSDAAGMRATAKPDGDGWVLSGTKTFATNAPVADVFLVFATLDRNQGALGACAFLVDRDTPGLTVGPPFEKMGLRTSPMSEVALDGCRLPATALLGRRGGGLRLFIDAMERERSMILASTVGTMEWNLEQTVEHARTRRQFGQPIGKFQAVSHRVVEMKLRLETARLLLYRLGWLLDSGQHAELDAALTKLYLSECYLASSLDAVQIRGGYGYMAEYDVERDVRDAVGSRLYSGTSEIQRNVAARMMGL